MKTIFKVLAFLVFTPWLATSCGDRTESQAAPLSVAEAAFADGRYAKAQQIADSIAIGDTFADLDAEQLCRLSLLFMRLGEVSGEVEANTGLAARALEAAVARSSDSTALFIDGLPFDDRARLVLAEAVAEGSRHPFDADSLNIDIDSLIIETDSHAH